jgi:uncharacterized membrane protein
MSLDPITAILDIGGKVIDKIFPDKTQADAAKFKLLELEKAGELAQLAGQLEINKVEAASSSKFIAGWRPFIGWICGCAFAWQFVAGPILVWALTVYGKVTTLPVINTALMVELLLAMLGIGGLRTYEKLKNVAGDHK